MLPDWCLIGFNQCHSLSKPSHIRLGDQDVQNGSNFFLGLIWASLGTRNGAKMEGQNDHAKTFRTWLVIFLLFLRHIDIWYDYVKVYGMTLDKDRVNRWWKTKHLSIFPRHLSNPKPDPFWRSIFLRWGSSWKQRNANRQSPPPETRMTSGLGLASMVLPLGSKVLRGMRHFGWGNPFP